MSFVTAFTLGIAGFVLVAPALMVAVLVVTRLQLTRDVETEAVLAPVTADEIAPVVALRSAA